jgi:superfamily II DNA or RNA helicase
VSLRESNVPPFLDTSSNDLVADFFVPLLKASIRYDRGVGYFSSGWLRVTAEGMVAFAENGGKARWVTSPILDEADWEALLMGDSARYQAEFQAILLRNIEDLAISLERDTRSALAWMVADGILDFRLALPRNKLDGDFHDKFGIFTDLEDNQVSFNGSYNDSIQGTRNYESIKSFLSWVPQYAPLVRSDAERFERLWRNEDMNVRVYELPEASREQIIQLREHERPYCPAPPRPHEGTICSPPKPHIPPNTQLREYQLEAIDSWFRHDCRGIFEMATGTGKTITALASATRVYDIDKRLALVVAVPYKHLVEQWGEVAECFGLRPVHAVESSESWASELSLQTRAFLRGSRDIFTVITTLDSMRRPTFSRILKKILPSATFIADEAHHLGAPASLRALPLDAPKRLGLSATPIRHYDTDGTAAILDFFGDVIYEFGLEKAIGPFLTPYYYYPIPVSMTNSEFQEFLKLTRQLQKLLVADGSDNTLSEAAKRIAIKRARVVNNSISKLDWVRTNLGRYDAINYALFYVGDKLFAPAMQLLGIEKGLKVHEFTQRQNNHERKDILERFSSRDLQALVAMKCLDEGVDVPPTRIAYFLASSGNPREFIQRRGRILRKFPGKESAILYDLISMPPDSFLALGRGDPDYPAVRAAVKREYLRIKEFSKLAINRYDSLSSLFDILNALELVDA